MLLILYYYYSELMNLHSFSSDAALCPNGMPDVKKGNSQLFFRLKKPVMFLRSDSPMLITNKCKRSYPRIKKYKYVYAYRQIK